MFATQIVGQELGLVAPEVGERGVDLPEDLRRLLLRAQRGVVGDGARDVDGAGVPDGLGEPRPNIEAIDAHRSFLSFTVNQSCSAVPPMTASSSSFERKLASRGRRCRLRT